MGSDFYLMLIFGNLMCPCPADEGVEEVSLVEQRVLGMLWGTEMIHCGQKP